MWGQWYGELDGGGTLVLVNIDRQTPNEGRVHVTAPKGNPTYFSALLRITDGKARMAGPKHEPGTPPTVGYAEFDFDHIDDTQMSGVWKTNWDTSGVIVLRRIDDYTAPSIGYGANSWPELYRMLNEYPIDGNMIWRGQGDAEWPLWTKFHRHGRRDLTKYVERDVDELRRHFGSIGKVFDMRQPDQLEALIHLGQHHDFPTPWLDWTKSAYVALYFAFENANSAVNGSVRIYAIDIQKWPLGKFRGPAIDAAAPYVELAIPDATHNPRAIFQKAVVMATNLARPEWFLANGKLVNGTKPAISFIQMPGTMREEVLSRLAKMGISPRTIYGGEDGIGRDLEQRFFDPGYDAK